MRRFTSRTNTRRAPPPAAWQRPLPAIHRILAGLRRSVAPRSLVSAEWLQALEQSARAIPDGFDGFGFEARLDGRGDLDFGAVMARHGCQSVSRTDNNKIVEDGLLDSPSWKLVRSFCTRWALPGSAEFEAVPHVFLEFDTSEGLHQLAAPSIFLGIAPAAQFSAGDGRYFSQPAVGGLVILPKLIAGLLAAEVEGSGRETLEECIRALPVGSIILHAGVMLSRSRAIRLHVAVPAQVASSYLRAIGFGATGLDVENLLTRYGAADPLATLQLELGDCVGDAVGLEFSPGSALDRRGADAWMRLMSQFVDDGLCSPERSLALQAWPVVSEVSLDPGGWPCTIRRDISHVKVACRPLQPLRAKAYISVVPQFSLFGPR